MGAEGGRSKEGGDDGVSGRAELVTDRWGRRKEEMTAGAHNQVKYLGVTIQYREFIVFLPYFWLLFACVKYYVKFLL